MLEMCKTLKDDVFAMFECLKTDVLGYWPYLETVFSKILQYILLLLACKCAVLLQVLIYLETTCACKHGCVY